VADWVRGVGRIFLGSRSSGRDRGVWG